MTLRELESRIREISRSGDMDADAAQVSVSVACFELPLESVTVRGGKCILCDARTAGRD